MAKQKASRGEFRMSFLHIVITRNGKREVIEHGNIHQRLVNGEWVDVKAPAKQVTSKVKKDRK
jgi:hypothetical protein